MTSPRHTTDPGHYLDQVGGFLRGRPVQHSILLSTAATFVAGKAVTGNAVTGNAVTGNAVTGNAVTGNAVAGTPANLWLWVEDDAEVVAAAQHTPPHGAYLSTGPDQAIRALARLLWRIRPELPAVAGLGTAPQVFAREWARLGGPPATPGMRQGVFATQQVTYPPQVAGRLRAPTGADRPLLRDWADQFFAESGATAGGSSEIDSRMDAGRLVVWDVEGASVSMASTTGAQGGVTRIGLVYTPPEHRRRGYASACVAALTGRELATSGRTCMLYTDLANPTSNGIYRALGYQHVGDGLELRFDGSESAS